MLKYLQAIGLTNSSKESVKEYIRLLEEGKVREKEIPVAIFKGATNIFIFASVVLCVPLLAHPEESVFSTFVSGNLLTTFTITLFIFTLYKVFSEPMNGIVYTSARVSSSHEKAIEVNKKICSSSIKCDDDYYEELDELIKEKSIMITGAGGKIGSHVAKSIIKFMPKSLILFEESERSLYFLYKDLKKKLLEDEVELKLIPILGSVCDEQLLNEVIEAFEIDLVYHLAGYNNPELVSKNIFSSVKNNVLGSYLIAKTASHHHVDYVIFGSSLGAETPRSILDGTRRLSEVIFSAASSAMKGSTVFTSVRFNDVLDSDNEMIQRFSDEILSGGPITVSHPDKMKVFSNGEEVAYLMTIASKYSAPDSIAILDSNPPIRIADLAKSMAKMHGLTLIDENNENGDIEIRYTGIRPGEKLFDEIALGDDIYRSTFHGILFKKEEPDSWESIFENIYEVERSCLERDYDALERVLKIYIPEFTPPDGTKDILFEGKHVNIQESTEKFRSVG